MAKDRSTIRSELRNDLRIDPNGKVWSDSVLNQLIHEAEIEVARRNITITDLETSTTFTTAIGDRSYDLPSDFLRIISVIYDINTVVNYTAATIAFVDSNPDTITDSANGFVTAGFASGMKLQIEGSTSNDGTNVYEIDTVAAGTITLVAGSAVVTEGAGATITLVGTAQPDHTTMLRMVEDIREIENAGFNNILGYPARYAIFQNDLYFDVLPKEVDTVQVTYVKVPAEMALDTTNSDMPDEWIPIVRLWAQYLAWGMIPGEDNAMNSALGRFERELRRKITMYGLNDYTVRQYRSSDWRANWRTFN